jgi:hypothetical protein
MAEAGIYTTSNIIDHTTSEGAYKSGGKYTKVALVVEYTLHAEDGSSVSTTVRGEGDDTGDKAGNKALAVAHKYALLQMFMIPTEDAKDPEDSRIDPQQLGESVAKVAKYFNAVTVGETHGAEAGMAKVQGFAASADKRFSEDIPFGNGPDVMKLDDDEIIAEFKVTLAEVGPDRFKEAFSKLSVEFSKRPMVLAKAFALTKGVKT